MDPLRTDSSDDEADIAAREWPATYAFLGLTLTAILAVIFLALGGAAPPPASMVRLSNGTGLELRNIRINGVAFGDLGIGARGPYRAMAPAYHYGRLQLDVQGKPFDTRPDDFTGETALGAGAFTYTIRRHQFDGMLYFDRRATKDGH